MFFMDSRLRTKGQRKDTFRALDGARQRVRGVEITLDYLDPAVKFALRGIARHGAHFLPRREKLRDDFAAYRSRRSRHQDHCCSSRICFPMTLQISNDHDTTSS